MSPPETLQQTVHRVYQSMLSHPEHRVPPFDRQSIYQVLDSLSRCARGWLALLTARHVLPIWEQVRLGDPMPAHLLDMTEAVLRGITETNIANQQVEKAWERLDKLGSDLTASSSSSPLFAAQAAISAVKESIGEFPFAGIQIDEFTGDEELDPWCTDTALWAAAAFAGRIGDDTSDSAKRREFWEWWLMQALPTAWQIDTGSSLESDMDQYK